ncbi:MAG TPA: serine/threonine protein kinase, partial [Phycisphaerales bacterium]|nr:serine/threonine protein kinase [Phycisphaerales bacterium]
MSAPDPMRDNRYWRIKSLYLRLVDLGDDDRRAILDAECSDDAELKRSVERLLDSDTRFCTEPWDDLVAFRDHLGGPNAAQCTMPERIGQYTVLGLIAEGGMGTVYRARQSSPERIVALKVLRSGLFPAMLRQRLEQESRVLARLEHPGIARVYEAGSFETEFGTLPFLSMEFVDGPTLQEYMTISRLSVPDRVHLVIELCEAIAHAHRRGVIHRDLKPRNILIDSDNRAKVVDFGIARLLDPDLEHATMHTTHGQLLGTLPYMSPEQASGLPEEIDTRSDLYALGVIAYELLACRLPFRFENESIHDALRTIQEIEPTPIERLDKRLRGDLSRVVAKAMAKEKERRYGSVSEFADDLRRYLRDEPITARPPAIGYRLGKFARRHRAPVAFGIIAALALLVGTSTAVWMAVERAAEAETLREVNSFWNDLLGAPNPAESVLGPDAHLEVSVVDYLDKASRRLGTIYSDSPKVEAELRSTIGTTYAALDQPERALPELRRAFDLYQASYGARHIKTLASRTRLGTVYAACGGLDEAEKIFTETLPSLEKAGGPGHET